MRIPNYISNNVTLARGLKERVRHQCFSALIKAKNQLKTIAPDTTKVSDISCLKCQHTSTGVYMYNKDNSLTRTSGSFPSVSILLLENVCNKDVKHKLIQKLIREYHVLVI